MTSIASAIIEVADPAAATEFYAAAFGPAVPVRVRAASDEPTAGFRGFTLSLIVSQPANVNALFDAAVGAGATPVKPVTKSMWGYGGVVQAPDGTLWKIATSSKKDSERPSRTIDETVLLLGVEDVAATKKFYVDQGLTVSRSFGSRYVEFDADEASPIKLALYRRKALAKDAGVPPEGSGSHRLAIAGAVGPFADLDGFSWEKATQRV